MGGSYCPLPHCCRSLKAKPSLSVPLKVTKSRPGHPSCPAMPSVLWLFSYTQGPSAYPGPKESSGFFGKSVLALEEEGGTGHLITAI